MQTIKDTLKLISKAYDRSENPLEAISVLTLIGLRQLEDHPLRSLGTTEGRPYSIFVSEGNKSRPILRDVFDTSPSSFTTRWLRLIEAIDPTQHRINLPHEEVNSVIYTAVMSIAASFDLWSPKSRKTPGTFFEILLGSILGQLLPTYTRSKHIPLDLPDDDEPGGESVSTDIQRPSHRLS